MRLLAGSNAKLTPVPATNTPYVCVALGVTDVLTLADGGSLQRPVAGTVAHRKTLTGSATPPVLATAVIAPAAPTLTVATANTPVPFKPGMSTMPSLCKVAESATMSGRGFADA